MVTVFDTARLKAKCVQVERINHRMNAQDEILTVLLSPALINNMMNVSV
jgi:hypothetical protein